jgi:diadenosine tetraphosphatase ApaH/serine/threonine PP2A family protein phosphatase
LKNLQAQGKIPPRAWIAGNHDLGLGGEIPLEWPHFVDEAVWALKQTRALAQSEEWEQFSQMVALLASLPTYTASPQAGVWLMHGRIQINGQGRIDQQSNVCGAHSYIKDRRSSGVVERAWEAMKHLTTNETDQPWLILAGHTHCPLLLRRFGEHNWRNSAANPGQPAQAVRWPLGCPKCGPAGPCTSRRGWEEPVSLDPSRPALVNPGSVGQPRDGCPAASYIILDLAQRQARVTFKRIGYDVRATQDHLARLARRQSDNELSAEDLDRYVVPLRCRLEKGV